MLEGWQIPSLILYSHLFAARAKKQALYCAKIVRPNFNGSLRLFANDVADLF